MSVGQEVTWSNKRLLLYLIVNCFQFLKCVHVDLGQLLKNASSSLRNDTFGSGSVYRVDMRVIFNNSLIWFHNFISKNFLKVLDKLLCRLMFSDEPP